MLSVKFLASMVIMMVLDIPFIYFISEKYKEIWPTPLKFNAKSVLGALAVYAALTAALIFVALQTPNPLVSSFIIGMSAYATYAFTVYALSQDWPLMLAGIETVWGGVLLFLTAFILQYVIPKAE